MRPVDTLGALVALAAATVGCSLVSLDDLADGDGGGTPTASTGPTAPTPSSAGGGGEAPGGTAAAAVTGTASTGGPGSGGGGGGGGGPAVPCGGTSVLADDFDDAAGVLGAWVEDDGSGVVRVENGEVVLRPPGDGVNTWVSFHSRFHYDLRGDAVAARVLETLPAPGQTMLLLHAVDGGYVGLRVDGEEILLVSFLDEVFVEHASLPHDPATMGRWRLRHEGTDVVGETSTDGSAWTEIGRVAEAELFDLGLVRVAIVARTLDVTDAPGVVRVDDLEGLHAGAAHCPAATLTDDFEDGVRAAAWSASVDRPECGPVEGDGEVRFPFVPGTSQYCELRTSRLYDLRGEGMIVRMTSQSWSATAEGYLHVEDRSGKGAIITATGEAIAAMQRVPERAILDDEPYVASDEPWWRIRDDGGTIRYELSSDGRSWRELGSAEAWFDSSAVQLAIVGGTWDDPAAPGVVAFDDVNLPPP